MLIALEIARANGDHREPMLTPASLRTFVVAFAIPALTLVAGCEQPGICDDFDAMERTERFVIPEHRAVAIGLAADAGYGPTCADECGRSATVGSLPTRRCSVGGATDGGVELTCTFGNVCR